MSFLDGSECSNALQCAVVTFNAVVQMLAINIRDCIYRLAAAVNFIDDLHITMRIQPMLVRALYRYGAPCRLCAAR